MKVLEMILKNGFIVMMLFISVSYLSTSSRADALENHHNLGAGVGIPFGIIGISYEFEMDVNEVFSVGPTLAAGTSVYAGGTSEVGLQLHFGKKNNLLRFGVSYWSGTNTIVDKGFLNYELVNGNTAGINLRFQMGSKRNNCIDVHMLRTLTPSDSEIQQKYGATKRKNNTLLGVGYVHRF